MSRLSAPASFPFCPAASPLAFSSMSTGAERHIRPPFSPAPGPTSTSQSAESIVSMSCSTTITELPSSLSFFSEAMSLRLSLWCRPMLGSSSIYSTFTSFDPIWVASLILWLSPPDSDAVARSRDRYSSPTSSRKPVLSLSSLSMSLAIRLSRFPNFPSRLDSHSIRSEISIAATSEMVLPSILKQEASWLSLVPWHTGHTILSEMSSTIPL